MPKLTIKRQQPTKTDLHFELVNYSDEVRVIAVDKYGEILDGGYVVGISSKGLLRYTYLNDDVPLPREAGGFGRILDISHPV